MTERTVVTGPNHHSLEDAAFNRARTLAEDGINRVLYVSGESTRHERVESHWRDTGDPLQLRTTTLMRLVFDCYEQVEGPTTRLSSEADRRALELALDEVVADKPWLSTQSHASVSLVDAFDRRFARFQSVGLTTPERVAAEFSDSSLADRIGDTTVDAYTAYHRHRDRMSDPWHVPYDEAFEAVADQNLPGLLPQVDVVIIDGYTDPGEIERQMLAALANSFDTIAILPTFSDTGMDGVDAATNTIQEFYDELGFDRESIRKEELPPLERVATDLYRNEPPATQTVPSSLEWRELPTPEREIRHIARDIRETLAAGVEPSTIGVVIPGLQSYDGYLADTFDTYDLEYTIDTGQAVTETLVGSAVENLVKLSDPAPRADALTEFVTNPVVDFLDATGEDAVLAAHRRSDAVRTDTLVRHLSADVESTIQSLLDRLEVLRVEDTAFDEAAELLQSLLAEFHISQSLETSASRIDTDREQSALAHVEELLTSFTDTMTASSTLSPSAAFTRALSGATLDGYTGHSDSVVVLDHLDAAGFAFEHLYIVGLTTEHFPSITRYPAFFERMVDAHPILDVLDDRLRDRYHFAMLLGNADSVTLTTPSTDPESTAVVRSPILDELNRTTGIEPTSGVDTRIGSREDLQRAIAPLDERRAAVDAAGERGDFSTRQTIRADRGISCATERASPDLSPRDGLLDSDTVEAIYPPAKREPYSASRIERYVNCGFQFYMDSILGLEDPDDIDHTPDPLEAGTFVHDTLERFFTELQSEPGEPVDISDVDQSELEAHMLDVALAELESASFGYDGLFYRRWLEQLFAGLSNPDANPYHSAPRPHDGSDRGLLVRFIEYERDRDGETKPAWFEVPFGDELHGDDDGDPFAIDLPNGGSVAFHGYIDRIDVSVDTAEPTIQLFDYKTGSTPSMTTTTGGTTFQLPVYLLAAEHVLDDELAEMGALAATYYKTKPPNDIYQPYGIESKFDSSAELHRFLSNVIPQRLQTITTAIEQGRFQTTVLTPNEANCEYCNYRRSCDVRHHQRRERVNRLGNDSETYIPVRATSTDFASVFSGDADE